MPFPGSCKFKGLFYPPSRPFLADKTELIADLFTIRIDIKPELHAVQVAHDLKRFFAFPFFSASSYSDVEILGILPHHHEIYVPGCFIPKRSPDPIKQLDRTEVDILVKIKADGEQYALFKNSWLYPVITDRAKIDSPVF